MDTDRRSLIKGATALTAAALFPTERSSAQPGAGMSRLKSVASVEVTRDETIEIPGGKEHFIEWTARDEAGTSESIRAHHVRTDTPVSYTMSTNMVSKITAADGSTSSHTKNISVSAIKGEEADGVRHDHVTLTVIAPDGESHRQSLEVPVRLDFPEFQGLSTAEIIKTFGTKVIRKEGL